jgi:membrane protein
MAVLQHIDRAQQRVRAGSILVATAKKFSEDHSTNLAAMIAFWAFFSLFPLLLVLVTVLGWVLSPSDRVSVLTHVSTMLPLLDSSSLSSLTGSWWPLALGLATALWSGLAVVKALQFALNAVWELPYHRQPRLLAQVRRSLAVLATVGAGLVFTTLLSSLITSASSGVNLGPAGRIGGYVLAVVLDVGLLVVAFRWLTERDVSVRDVLPGAVLAGVAFFVLQELSAFIISRHLKSAQSTYGHFATVITILWWFYLQSLITLLGAQLNTVLREHLYPRSIVDAPQTEADDRALQAYAAERTYHPDEDVRATVARR